MDPELGSTDSLDLTVSHYSYPHVRFSASIDYFYEEEEKEELSVMSLNSEAIRQLPQAECSYQPQEVLPGVLPQHAVLPNTLQAEHSKHHIHPLSHHAKYGRIPSRFNIIQSVEASSSSSVGSDDSSALSPAIISRHGDKQTYNFRRLATRSTVGSSSDDAEPTSSPSDFKYTIPQPIKAQQQRRASSTNSMSSQPSYYSIISHDSLIDKMMKEVHSVISDPKASLLSTRWTFLRVIGLLLIAVAFVEIGIGAKIYHLSTNQKYGAWWAGFVALLGGFLAVLSPYHVNLMIATSVTISPAIVAAIVAAFTDGYAAAVYSDIATCTRKADDQSFHFYGDTNTLSYENAAMKCYNDYAGGNTTPNDCVCVTAANQCTPEFKLFKSTDCSIVIDEYPTLLFTSMGLCIGLFFLTFVGSVISCYNVWHKKEKENKVRIDLKKKRSMALERGEDGSLANM
jgi:hypothetical protein